MALPPFSAFLEDIRLGRPSDPGLPDARAALVVVEEIYRQSGYPVPSEPATRNPEPGTRRSRS